MRPGPPGQPVVAAGILVALIAFPSATRAEAPPCQRPKYELLRYEESYAFLSDPLCRTDMWDGAKYRSLGQQAYWSVGFDLRERYEYVRNPDWGRDPPDASGYLLQRLMLYGDLHLNERVRTFVQLKSVLVGDRAGGARPTDEDVLDLHQAFVDIVIGPGPAGSVTLRGGRQEVAYGSQRLISVREGPNVRRSFDGLRAIHRLGTWQTDAFVLAPVETNPGIFDDWREPGQLLWGVYAAGPVRERALGLDVYYLGLRRPDASFDQGSGRELRHSVGTRIWGEPGHLDYNFELVYQWGRFGDGNISAWTAASDTGYTIEPLPMGPRIGLKADISSGDRDPANPNLQTFNPLFPKGNYFGEASLVAPMNHIDLHPSVALHVTDTLVFAVEWMFFWRQNTSDGLYRISTAPQVPASAGQDRYVGSQAEVSVEWEVDRHLRLIGDYAHFFAGAFLQEAGLGKDVDFVAIWLAYRF